MYPGQIKDSPQDVAVLNRSDRALLVLPNDEAKETDSLRQAAFIKRRMESYYNYRRMWLERLSLPSVPIKESAIPLLVDSFFTSFGWAILDTEYIIIDANEKFAQLVGLTREELIMSKRQISELTEPRVQATTLQQLKTTRSHLVPKFIVSRYHNLHTGEVIPVTIYAFPIVDESSSCVGSFGLIIDIHDGVRTQAT